MICSPSTQEKFVKQGLSYNHAKYKATYLYCYLADEINKLRSRLRNDPYNELNQCYLKQLLNNKNRLLNAKTNEAVDFVCDKLAQELSYGFEQYEKWN